MDDYYYFCHDISVMLDYHITNINILTPTSDMNLSKNFFAAMLSMMTVFTAAADNYKATITFTPDEDGAMVYMYDYDSGAKIDSVTVDNSVAVFTGDINRAVPVRLTVDGMRAGQFILEPGEIAYNADTRQVQGGKLNTIQNEYGIQAMALTRQYRATESEAERKEIENRYNTLTDSVMKANIDNPLGYLLFMDQAYSMTLPELDAALEATPSLKEYKRVGALRESLLRKENTQPGKMFADFEIEYDGVKHRLSDVVGKGDYVLVDFWASWCGPCIRQTAVLKDIYKEYGDKGLKVLGVAVWDEPAATQKAIVDHQLPWESWLNGQRIPTDIYGISGIPCIILFGPDGTILSRDKQDDELREAVRTALSTTAP